jgi:endonuclease/exonuclease/phosphatase family metal-dependent hydrolase
MKLMTWNIQWGRGIDLAVDTTRIVREARAIADFDLLCLQEVAVNFPGLPGSRGEHQVNQIARALPGYSAHFGAAVDVTDGHGGRSLFGNLLLSRLPVFQVYRHLLPWPADPGVSSMPRLALECVVAAPWGPLRVTTTHLEYYSEIQRMAQVEALLARGLRPRRPPAHPPPLRRPVCRPAAPGIGDPRRRFQLQARQCRVPSPDRRNGIVRAAVHRRLGPVAAGHAASANRLRARGQLGEAALLL